MAIRKFITTGYTGLLRLLVTLSLNFFVSANAFALQTSASLENIANNLVYGTDIVTKFFHAICILIAVLLWIMSISFYKAHRQNPKYIPLDRPIFYLILGFVLLAIPFLNVIFGSTGSSIDLKKQEEQKNIVYQNVDEEVFDPNAGIHDPDDIDTPIHIPNDYEH